MNIHHVRVLLADTVKQIDGQWTPSTATDLDMNATLMAQVGHAAPTPATFRGQQIDLPLTLWANEGNSRTAVEALYGALSWDAGSIVRELSRVVWVKQVTVDAVAPRQEGPTGFLPADLTVTIDLSKLDG